MDVAEWAAEGTANGFAAEAREELGELGAELLRARTALGHGLLHLGAAARCAWLWGTRRAVRVHPEILLHRLATLFLACGCDKRDPRRCTGAFIELGQQHGWCSCAACHGAEGGAA